MTGDETRDGSWEVMWSWGRVMFRMERYGCLCSIRSQEKGIPGYCMTSTLPCYFRREWPLHPKGHTISADGFASYFTEKFEVARNELPQAPIFTPVHKTCVYAQILCFPSCYYGRTLFTPYKKPANPSSCVQGIIHSHLFFLF